MRITQISVNASRTIANPREKHGQLRFSCCYTAELAEGDDVNTATLNLQAMAEAANDSHERRVRADAMDKVTPLVNVRPFIESDPHRGLPNSIFSANPFTSEAIS